MHNSGIDGDENVLQKTDTNEVLAGLRDELLIEDNRKRSVVGED